MHLFPRRQEFSPYTQTKNADSINHFPLRHIYPPRPHKKGSHSVAYSSLTDRARPRNSCSSTFMASGMPGLGRFSPLTIAS